MQTVMNTLAPTQVNSRLQTYLPSFSFRFGGLYVALSRSPIGRTGNGELRLNSFSFAAFKPVELDDDRSPSIAPYSILSVSQGFKVTGVGYNRTVTNTMTGWKNAAWLQHCISVKDPPPVVGIGSKEG